MQFDVASTCIGFLLGTFTGAAGGYFNSKYTDARRKKEAAGLSKKKFAQVATQMPELMRRMQQDLTQEPLVRDFFVLSHPSHFGGSSTPAFRYSGDVYPGLHSMAQILENHGYVLDITPATLPKYRMTEEFVTLVMKWK